MSIPALLLIVVGMLLIWSALKDKNPLQEVKNVLRGA